MKINGYNEALDDWLAENQKIEEKVYG